ncbi:hypothetical protein CLG94_12715 [Candidatus Methylomirabilis limnetica]|uniref:Uncharacterized protein n=1 Tax=Candidatus Methylomirabilis limnetica TaxID=2033718 RepID=A0A2T4TUQ6_9BACT|nr:hypothetical protein CLG94_12715 [Candidatus Methylomirabilis limnetica]
MLSLFGPLLSPFAWTDQSIKSFSSPLSFDNYGDGVRLIWGGRRLAMNLHVVCCERLSEWFVPFNLYLEE